MLDEREGVTAKKICKNRDHGLGITATGVISSMFSLLRFSVSFVIHDSDKAAEANDKEAAGGKTRPNILFNSCVAGVLHWVATHGSRRDSYWRSRVS